MASVRPDSGFAGGYGRALLDRGHRRFSIPNDVNGGIYLAAFSLRKEFSLKIPDAYLVFYTLSFVFSTYVLTIGPSWINFLGNQSSLPWLVLGVLNRRVLWGSCLVMLFTLNELLIAYAPLTTSIGLCVTAFAMGVAWSKRSWQPLFCWCAGNLMAILVLSPLFIMALEGFATPIAFGPFAPSAMTEFSIPAMTFPFSYLVGNWSEPWAILQGDKLLESLSFPYAGSLLACAAAWCVILVIVSRAPWQPLEKVCAGLAVILCLFVMRPIWLSNVIYYLPFFRSMRWPFREGIIFLFFIHLLLVLRYPARMPRWQAGVALFSLAVFVLPIPFIRVPSLNARVRDRQLLFSGDAESYWAKIKAQLKPTDEILTVVDWPHWKEYSSHDIPFTLLGTGNLPAFFQVRCISGYSPTTRPWIKCRSRPIRDIRLAVIVRIKSLTYWRRNPMLRSSVLTE